MPVNEILNQRKAFLVAGFHIFDRYTVFRHLLFSDKDDVIHFPLVGPFHLLLELGLVGVDLCPETGLPLALTAMGQAIFLFGHAEIEEEDAGPGGIVFRETVE